MAGVNKPPVAISSGNLDATFGGDGVSSAEFAGATYDEARGITIQSDGRYVVAGWSDTGGGNSDFAVVRFNADGSLDTSFSGGGKQTTGIVGADKAYALAIQSDGKIVVAGVTNAGASGDFAIVRYDANGALDSGFSGDGIQTTSFSASEDAAAAIAIQSDGNIVAAGRSNFSFAIARYDSAGGLDSSFDTDGLFTGSFGSSTSVANAMALQPDGKIVVAGYGWSGTSWDFGVARLTAAGALDDSFSADGKALFHLNSSGTSVEEFNAIAIQSDGKILLAGRSPGSGAGDTYDAVLMRLDTGGNLDAAFGGGDGVVTLDLSNWDEFNSVVVQSDGKILVAGRSYTTFQPALMARFNADGTPDTSFDGDGVFSVDYGNNEFVISTIHDLAIAPNGQVVAAGDMYSAGNDFGMLRLASGVTDQSAISGNAFSYVVPAGGFFDADGDPLTYLATLADGAALPAWLSFDATTRTFSGTPGDDDFGTQQVKVTASDGAASVSASFQLETTTAFIEALRFSSFPRWDDGSQYVTPGSALTFSFMDAAPGYASANETSTFLAFTEEQKSAARAVLELYAAIAGITFTEVSDAGNGGQLRFGNNSQDASAAYFVEYSSPAGGAVWVSKNDDYNLAPDAGTYAFQVLIHEIGHALNLKHPGPYGGGEGPYLDAGVDNTRYTVMSYDSRTDALHRDVTGATAGDIHYFDVYASTPMLYDVAAVQFIYGANTSTRSGNDTYSFDPATPFFKTLWDGGGTDTISVSNFSEACAIDLRDGHYSSIRILSDTLPPGFTGWTEPTYVGSDNLALAFGAVIENATGGAGADNLIGNNEKNVLRGNAGSDTLYGNAGDDDLEGGDGADLLDGGLGSDTALFSGALFQYTLTPSSAGWTLTGPDGIDTLTGIEFARFSDQTISLGNIAGTPGTTDTRTINVKVTAADASDISATDMVALTAPGTVWGKTYFWNKVASQGSNAAGHVLLHGVTVSAKDGGTARDGATAAGGAFSVTDIAASTTSVTVSQTVSAADKATVTLGDALEVLKLYLGTLANPSPYKYLAADFNADNKVTLTDALGIAKSVLDKPGALEPAWVFVDEDADVSGLTKDSAALPTMDAHPVESDPSLNLVAVLRGDANGSWKPAATASYEVLSDDYFTDAATGLIGLHPDSMSAGQFGL